MSSTHSKDPLWDPQTPEEVAERLRLRERMIINGRRWERAELVQVYGAVWDTVQVQKHFTIRGFAAPYCSAIRKKDGVFGMLTFQHNPRYYFDFKPAPNGKIDLVAVAGVADVAGDLSKALK